MKCCAQLLRYGASVGTYDGDGWSSLLVACAPGGVNRFVHTHATILKSYEQQTHTHTHTQAIREAYYTLYDSKNHVLPSYQQKC